MAFEPRGKAGLLYAAMKADPGKVVWSALEAANVMGIPRAILPTYLRPTIDHGLIFVQVDDRRSFYSLKPFEPGTPEKLMIPTIKKPGDWVPPVMTPPRGATGYVPRQSLPEPLHQVIAPPPLPAVAASSVTDVEKTPEPADPPKVRRRAAPTQEPEVEEEVPEEFNVCRWLDGDIDLYGLLETEDGAMRIPADKVPQLLKLLGGVPA